MNNMPRMVGGITVAGLVTGTHMIEDIKIAVPHQVAVFIPADLAYKSKDLWRGLGQKRLFQLTGGSGLAVESNTRSLPVNNDAELQELQAENKSLRRQLEESERRNLGLQEAIRAMQGHLSSTLQLSGILEKIESGQLVVRDTSQPAHVVTAAAPKLQGVVGGETPAYIPDDIMPGNAKTNIKVDAELIATTSVTDTAKALREARRSRG